MVAASGCGESSTPLSFAFDTATLEVNVSLSLSARISDPSCHTLCTAVGLLCGPAVRRGAVRVRLLAGVFEQEETQVWRQVNTAFISEVQSAVSS